jgi:hypothetical protein
MAQIRLSGENLKPIEWQKKSRVSLTPLDNFLSLRATTPRARIAGWSKKITV